MTAQVVRGSLLTVLVAFDPVSAYRALAFDVLPAALSAGRPVRAGWLPVAGLLCWTAVSFLVAAFRVWTPLTTTPGGERR